MRGPHRGVGAGARARARSGLQAIALVATVMTVLASCPATATGKLGDAQLFSETVHLDPIGEVGGASTRVLTVDCVQGWEVRYSWRSERPVRFSIEGPDGKFVRVVDDELSGLSTYTARLKGPHTLRWSNPSTSAGTDLAYTVKALPPEVLGDSGGQGDGDPNAYTLDELTMICIAGILASAFSIVMLLGALYIKAKPWRVPRPPDERRCLLMYSQAYGGGARPPIGPPGGARR
jgi:hypothetical protein